MKQQTVCVVGLGYIGLPTALLIAESGIRTIGFDVDKNKIESLVSNKLYFEEKGLEQLFNKVQNQKSITFSTSISKADVFIIAVPTPQKKATDGQSAWADLKYVFSALDMIKPVFEDGNLIVIESTVGPRDCSDQLVPYIEKWNTRFHFAHCPERAIPGNTLFEMVHNDRIVGATDAQSALLTKELYSNFVKGALYETSVTIAASCKVMENTFRAVNIALANEFALQAERLGFNVWEAISLANKHPRVSIHQPGPGVGGHCIPIDPWFFVEKNTAPLIKLALEINEEMSQHVANTIKHTISSKKISNPTIAILGYAYKKNVDDTRETPAESIIAKLPTGSKVFITDPYVSNPSFVTLTEALTKANIVVLATDHDEYTQIKFEKYPNIQVIYDSRNCFSNAALEGTQALVYKLGTPVEYDKK